MGKINVLSFAVANLIAAGEVVDRPASVIKELLENSIDAGADSITVEIQNGGVSFMRVSDNGCGIDSEDLPIAVKRHATSKIKDAEDLDGILTLGFRGEALAAISSVSNMRIISKTRDKEFGTMLESHGGEITSISERGCGDGTTVIVEELFANVPARRKFLKKDMTEAMAVSVMVEKIALSRPDIAFKFISDGNIKMQTVGDGNLKNTIYAVLGRDFASKLIEVNGENEGVKISGFIGRSDNIKANRNYQNFFINGRYVKSKTACAAIEQAYTSYIASEKFPVCVLCIDVNPKIVDVNVHPAKLEVKFSNEKAVFEAVYYSVRTALESNSERPELKLPEEKVFPKKSSTTLSNSFLPIIDRADRIPASQRQIDIQNAGKEYVREEVRTDAVSRSATVSFAPPAFPRTYEKITPQVKTEVKSFTAKDNHISTAYTHEEKIPNVTDAAPPQKDDPVLPEYRMAGEVFNAYIIVEAGEKMLLIDKHAAHERIIFEDLKSNMKNAENASQMLLIPIELSLSKEEYDALLEYKKELSDVGFEIMFGNDGKKISAMQIPCGIEAGACADLLDEMAGDLASGKSNPTLTRDIIFEKALYQGSCKAAIKAGREYPIEYNEWIVKKLQSIPNITVCPHGRPVAIEITKKSLDKQFSRL